MPIMTLELELDLDFLELRNWLTEQGLIEKPIGQYTKDEIVAMVRHIMEETAMRRPARGLTAFPETADGMDEVPY